MSGTVMGIQRCRPLLLYHFSVSVWTQDEEAKKVVEKGGSRIRRLSLGRRKSAKKIRDDEGTESPRTKLLSKVHSV